MLKQRNFLHFYLVSSQGRVVLENSGKSEGGNSTQFFTDWLVSKIKHTHML